MVERTAADLTAPARFAQARRVLDELEAEWTDPLLLKEITYLKSAAPSYLFHEYLAECNTPMQFADFATQLDDHGLRYVGEAGPRHAVVELEDAWGLIPESMASRWLDAEAALDDAHAIRFRRALIARADAPCAQPPQAEALTRLAFHADLRSDDEIDLETASEQAFVNPAGDAFPVAHPAMKVAAMILSAAYPVALAYAELLASTRQTMADYGVVDEIDETAFRNALFQLVMAHGVLPSLDETPYPNEPAERPCAHALARLQAASPGWTVGGARHVALDLDKPGRMLLCLLDGSRTLDELTAILQNVLADAGYDQTLEAVRAMTHRQVWLFARQGLLLTI